MIIYVNRQPKYKFSRFQRLVNMLWPALHGIDIEGVKDGDVEVLPVYLPFARYEKGDGQLLIELAFWRTKAIVIYLFNRPPFYYVTRTDGVTLDPEEVTK